MLETLEEYLIEMERRNNNNNNSAINSMKSREDNNEDLWKQLQQKEHDLLLAAELGKALLEKNEDLKRQQDLIVDEYTKKLEAVEQDRHLLKQKLMNKESELDSHILELENDISELKNKLTIKDNQFKQWEKEKNYLINELQAQNQRLTQQLKDGVLLESNLQQQIEQLKEQCLLGKTNLNEHLSNVDSLKDELELLNNKNKELERRLNLSISERDTLTNTLDEASDRILLLERYSREQDLRYQHSIKDFSLQQEQLTTEERLNNVTDEHRSLLAEMDISEPTLSQECMSVYRQLRSLVQQLKSHHNNDDDSGLHSDCSTTSVDDDKQFSTGLLSEIAQELVGLVLDMDVVRLLDRLEQSRQNINERDLELGRRNEKIMELNSKISVYEVELEALKEECDRIKNDVSNTYLAKDDVVLKAREERDIAVKRKTKIEIDLAKTRVELMQANSQLLEAIQQKVELSQQLEQWQMDMQELINEQLKTKLTSQERKTRHISRTPPEAPPKRRLLSFFQL